MLDMVTMDEVMHDLYLREFAYDTSLYGGSARSTIRSASTLTTRARCAVARGPPADLEPGLQARVLSRRLADPLSAR